MRFAKAIGLVGAISVMLLFAVSAAHAETLKQSMKGLDVLPLNYGANTIKIGKNDILITKGYFASEVAGAGDVYSILVHESLDSDDKNVRGAERDRWQIARYDEGSGHRMFIVTVPHTYEDSLVSVRFLMPVSGRSDLYLLESKRSEASVPVGSDKKADWDTTVTFTLYKLQQDEDFGIFYLHQVSWQVAKKKYCNADWAMKMELDIALPDNDDEQYNCEKMR